MAVALGALWLTACAYRPFAGPLRPAPRQAPDMIIHDDGSVAYVKDRFEVRVRPVSDDELNRQFASASGTGPKSTNAYTFGDTRFGGADSTRSRFTVFHVFIKNYAYPKVLVEPSRIVIRAENGREYWSLSVSQLENYYRAYALGYRGNAYARYRDRLDLLRRTLLPGDAVFAGQEANGYVVFPVLHADVTEVKVVLEDVVLRFDYRDEPVETVDIAYTYTRQVGRRYPGGRVAVTYDPAAARE